MKTLITPAEARELALKLSLQPGQIQDALRSLADQLEAAQPSQDEPYAWAWDEATYMGGDVRGSQWRSKMGKHKPTNDWMTRNVTALYLHPAQPREPMTQDEIDKDLAQVIGDYPRKEGNPVGKLNWYRSLYKRAEAFHHIGEKSE